jgi:hypothetical protein
MATTQSDFVQIQLTAAGAQFAAKGLQIANGRFTYKFTPGVPVKVLTSEWAKALSRKRIQGKLLFEEVPKPEAAPAVAAAPIAASAEPTADQKLNKLHAQEAEIKAEEAALQSKSVQVQTK